MTYTIEDINDAWTDYKSQKVIKFLKDGKEMFKYLTGERLDLSGILNAKTVDLQSVISFPDYLRTKWKQ